MKRLAQAVLDRVLAVGYANETLLQPTTRDWKKILNKQFKPSSIREQALRFLKIHINEDGFLAYGRPITHSGTLPNNDKPRKNYK